MIRRAHAVQPVTAVQSEYSLWWRRPKWRCCRPSKNWGSASCPTALSERGPSRGRSTRVQLSTTPTSAVLSPRFAPEALKANQALVDLLGRIAAQGNATPARIALAWPLAQKPWIVPIPGTTKLERLDENIGAVAVELTSGDLRKIDSAAAMITVQGARYPEKLERSTGR